MYHALLRPLDKSASPDTTPKANNIAIFSLFLAIIGAGIMPASSCAFADPKLTDGDELDDFLVTHPAKGEAHTPSAPLSLAAKLDAAALAKINSDRDEGSKGTGPVKRTSYKPVPSDYSLTKAKAWIAADQKSSPTGWKYIYIPAEVTANKETLNTLRVAIFKTWNHLSWQPGIDLGRDVSDGSGLVFAVSPTALWGSDGEKNWAFIANCSPKRNIRVSPAPRGECARFGTNEPVAAPQFVFNGTNGGPYANIHKTPPDFSTFANKFKLGPIDYTSTHKNAIVCGPRIVGYSMVSYKGQSLLYSFTSDEFDGRDGGEITYRNAPTIDDLRSTGAFNAGPNDGNTAVASEWWMQLPNGFIYYSIHGEGSQERGKAEVPFAIDPANWAQNYTLATGRSCITCHSSGINGAPSDTEFAGKNGWSSNEQLNVLYATVREKFQASMRHIVEKVSDGDDALQSHLVNGTVEPVSKAIMLVEGAYQPRSSGCNFFCRGKYGAQRENLCETLPAR